MKAKKIIPFTLSLLFICTVWELIAFAVRKPDIFPSLSCLFKQILVLFARTDFYLSLLLTLFRGLLGFSISCLSAFLLAALSSHFSFWKSFLQPFLVILRSVPVISFVLLALLWLNSEQLPLFIAFVTMFPILYQNIETAFSQTDKKWLEMAKVYGKSAGERFLTIYLPASGKQIFDGVGTTMGFGWRAIIIGEALAQPLHGIGTGMKQAQIYIHVPMLMAWTIVAILISYLFDILIKELAKIKRTTKINTDTDIALSPDNVAEKTKERQIIIRNLNKKYGNQTLFDNFSITIDNKSVNCLRGISGKGKTTLLRMISGLEPCDGGTIHQPANSRYAYSFQDVRLLPWLTAYENIGYTALEKTDKTDQLILFLAREFDMLDHLNKYPRELSGGQQQRIELIKALVNRSDILLMDEPLTGLDDDMKRKILVLVADRVLLYHPIVIWATHENIVLKGINVRNIQI
ncbi:MAG: ATP-binding cassette domain-containing protein [Prevotellaceae bacterium]|jgi:ABC-type nitrate/sulfonate/bicarbonate transport system permease component/ABC-type nitrate/sulfonate/bicarbonate transport system ATPase subunit|nr:ATP-binding cassette domain-containing protein [Prevotellaceae bacterium]